MSKRTKKRAKKSFHLSGKKLLALSLVSVVAIGILLSIGVISFEMGTQHAQKKLEKKENEISQLKKLQALLETNQKKVPDYDLGISEIDDLKASQEHEKKTQKPKKKEKKKLSGKPKVAIILDDISFAAQVRNIKKLGLPITMSFLPANAIHPNTPLLAKNEEFYMVHLPLEALSHSHAEPNTLHVSDSHERIDKTIAKIKKDFPRLEYLNNHTGSLFTSDYLAMSHLYDSFEKHDLVFVDSRTTSKTKAPLLSKERGLEYIGRDVFLDHESSVSYVQGQIREAIRIAKISGLAIAIGHPRRETLKAIESLKDELSTDVELIYLNQI